MMTDPDPDLLTPEQAASFLHMSWDELVGLMAEGRGPTVTLTPSKFGGLTPRYTLLDLINYQLLRHDQTEGE